MAKIFGDWKIEVNEIIHPAYGKGFRAVAYIPKNNGIKANIREFGLYCGQCKSKTDMFNYTIKFLEK